MKSGKHSVLRSLGDWASGPRMRASLFHSINDEPEPSILPDLWQLLRHPLRSFQEERHAPRTRASLFHYIAKPEAAASLDWKALLKELCTGYRFALFIPSLWSDHRELAEERAALRTRRMEAGVASLILHGLIVVLAILLVSQSQSALPQKDLAVFVSTPMNLPFDGDGHEGGGGGGGGKLEKLPPSGGRIPETSQVQYLPPDPGQPKPLEPVDNPLELRATVQVPVELPADLSLPIGNPTALPSEHPSSGPGIGGGIGTGEGTGDGPGTGSGVGPGSKGGIGGGSDGGVGNDVGPGLGGTQLTQPEQLYSPSPNYTEEARKARTEGLVVLQVKIRTNGTVDVLKVLKGLGYGLDESAIQTIAAKWRFKPAKLRGVPIDFLASIEVLFHIY